MGETARDVRSRGQMDGRGGRARRDEGRQTWGGDEDMKM